MKNIDLIRTDMSNKLVIFKSNGKRGGVMSFGGKRSYLKRIRGYNTGKEGGGSNHSSANKNNVTAENLLNYF